MSATSKYLSLFLSSFLFFAFDLNNKLPFYEKLEVGEIHKVEAFFDKSQKGIFVSVEEQKLYLMYKEEIIKSFDISTSKYGIGYTSGSQKTPQGLHHIQKKIGDGVPINGIFKYRKYQGDLSIPNDPDFTEKDLITTRILWLAGNEQKNSKTYQRCIYIHGTPEESKIGTPSSHGCIRMKNVDVYTLYEFVDKGTPVYIY